MINSVKPCAALIFAVLLVGCQTSGSSSGEYYHSSGSDPVLPSHGHQVVSDFTNTAPSKSIERFELRDGDCIWNRSFYDCDNDRERSEMSTRDKTSMPTGNTEWFGWSIHLPTDFKSAYPVMTTMGQFHQMDGKPAWIFTLEQDGLQLNNWLRHRTWSPTDGTTFPLIKTEDMIGQWNKIEINVKWSDEEDGFFKLYLNNKLAVDFKGQTSSEDYLYFKYGIYRNGVSLWKYKAGKKALKLPTQIVYYANVKRGNTRASIQK